MTDLLDDGEVLRTPGDKNPGGKIPGEGRQRRSGRPVGRAIIWQEQRVEDLGKLEIWGKLPIGFCDWAYGVLGCRGSQRILHVCSGGLGPETPGVRVDIRREVMPDVVGDGTALPFSDNSFDAVLIDPPYSVEYAQKLYNCDYPRPSALLREAARVLRPTKPVGIVHFLVPRPEPGLKLCEVRGITTGCGYRIRAMTVFRKEQRGLWDGPS